MGVRRRRLDAPARSQHQRPSDCGNRPALSLGGTRTAPGRRFRPERESVLTRPMTKPVVDRADLLPLLAEVFRSHGYEGATLALISQATGLGKGSLYHFFPGGKAQMAADVLAE